MTLASAARAELIARLDALSTIADPFAGVASPATVAARSKLWPDERWSITPVASTAQAGRTLEEYVFRSATGEQSLPVAIMFEGTQARIYSAHELVPSREPLLPVDPTITASAQPGDFLDGYFEHLVAGDLEASIAMFEPDGYIQHSNGVRYQGAERIREDYTNMFKANGGRILVKFANVTDDGERRAFECVMPSGRPAVAQYERGATGKIAAIRISL